MAVLGSLLVYAVGFPLAALLPTARSALGLGILVAIIVVASTISVRLFRWE